MNAFTHHFAFEFRSGIRNKNLLMLNYLFPLGFYLMLGFIMTSIDPTFQKSIIPAMIIFAVLAATILGLPDPLVNARENGVYRSYKVNGVPSFSILVIPGLTTILHLTIVAIIIAVSAPLLFDAPLPLAWPEFVLVFIAMAFASVGLGVLIGVISPTSRMTVLWSQLIFLPSMLLGGLMLPYNILPEGAQKVAQLVPATHAMNAFNALAMGGTADFAPWGSIAILFIGGVLGFALALFLFSWDSRNTTRRGHPLLALLALVPYVAGIFIL